MKLKPTLAAAALLIASTQAHAAVINVGGQCTLVRAIVSANNDASPQGFCTPGRGPDTINLQPNFVYSLTTINQRKITFYGSGLPLIRTAITINGNGATIKRAPTAPMFDIFIVMPAANLTLNNVKVYAGRVKSHRCCKFVDGMRCSQLMPCVV
jgi:hypothetical protein